jgi:ribosomal protein S18 acetylase RimI-like enzyme
VALAFRHHPVASQPVVRTLEPSDVAALRLPTPRGAMSLKQALERLPGRSVWAPDSLEYALLAPWRNRTEIAVIEELDAVRHLVPLLRAAFERCVAHGDELMLAIELESSRPASRFERAGLELLEEVITYELDGPPRVVQSGGGVLRRRPVTAFDITAIDHLLAIDQAAFPWLWRNNRREFDVYLRTPGVSVTLLEANGSPVAYVGSTLFAGWGHLDRIAVVPDAQGLGFGRQALASAVDSLRRQGAQRVALSTQRTNRRSQRLYERFGFLRTPELDYRLFGSWCHPHRAGEYRAVPHAAR